MKVSSVAKVYLKPYTPPDWASSLATKPTSRVELAQLPTPIHPWDVPGIPAGISVSIKRDDLTGSTLSGNKVRKLEFLLAEAVSLGCKHVVTCGGIQSNHCRATAIAARQLGIQSHLLLRTDPEGSKNIGCEGNLILDRMVGAKIYTVPKHASYMADLKGSTDKLVNKIRSELGEEVYNIPVGGSNSLGIYGYIEAWKEMIQQGILDDFDDIVFSIGSGGTAAGLAIGNYLTGSKLKCHAVAASGEAATWRCVMDGFLVDFELNDVRSDDVIEIYDGYTGRGYGLSSKDELDFLTEVSRTTGIMLDPVYSGKAAYGMMQEMQKTSNRFKGNRVLFLHTGGIFGLMDGRMDHVLMKEPSANNQICKLSDVIS